MTSGAFARCLSGLLTATVLVAAGLAVGDEPEEAAAEVLRGRVELTPGGNKSAVVLKTKDGELIPLVEDTRGRAFRKDPRLREIDVELTVRRSPEAGAVNVLAVREVAKDGSTYEVDYWCSICSIAMFELKECECCQGEIELRKRKIAE